VTYVIAVQHRKRATHLEEKMYTSPRFILLSPSTSTFLFFDDSPENVNFLLVLPYPLQHVYLTERKRTKNCAVGLGSSSPLPFGLVCYCCFPPPTHSHIHLAHRATGSPRHSFPPTFLFFFIFTHPILSEFNCCCYLWESKQMTAFGVDGKKYFLGDEKQVVVLSLCEPWCWRGFFFQESGISSPSRN
jgi:hypothetical protein